MPHVDHETEIRYTRDQAPCPECQIFERRIAVAFWGNDEKAEAEARQEYQRHRAQHGEVRNG